MLGGRTFMTTSLRVQATVESTMCAPALTYCHRRERGGDTVPSSHKAASSKESTDGPSESKGLSGYGQGPPFTKCCRMQGTLTMSSVKPEAAPAPASTFT